MAHRVPGLPWKGTRTDALGDDAKAEPSCDLLYSARTGEMLSYMHDGVGFIIFVRSSILLISFLSKETTFHTGNKRM